MVRMLSRAFRSIKPHNPNPKPPKSSLSQLQSSSPFAPSASPSSARTSQSRSASKSWSVYLILCTNAPIKTYVGVTTNFSRRLKEHNGELKGGAKASRAGRPWICACIIQGFKDQSEACSFESKWKNVSKKLPRKRSDKTVKQVDNGSLVLQHSHAKNKSAEAAAFIKFWRHP
ncbi:structure-specific endonuclease subunit SLX1 isoform X2 [Malania oleifera]|uniref:structure-specific endonuclease subunit SLX1 isoform X2 n=1 Tax=Malania oleifera TaxID=397392 RepID=UPI0025AE0382|nr:structure-specific endonuclease subunit SLX1 isoform X2 [Malania oleifera]